MCNGTILKMMSCNIFLNFVRGNVIWFKNFEKFCLFSMKKNLAKKYEENLITMVFVIFWINLTKPLMQ